MENILFADICLAFAKFLVVAGGGVILGVIYGFLGAFITKYTVNARIIEPTFVFTICFMAYLTAECFGLSAILAIVFCAFTMNSYVEHNISAKSHTTVKYGMKMISHICETLIFMCLGWAAISDFWKSWDTGFVLWKVQQLIFDLIFIRPYSSYKTVHGPLIMAFRLDRTSVLQVDETIKDSFLCNIIPICFSLYFILPLESIPDRANS